MGPGVITAVCVSKNRTDRGLTEGDTWTRTGTSETDLSNSPLVGPRLTPTYWPYCRMSGTSVYRDRVVKRPHLSSLLEPFNVGVVRR